MRCLLCTYLACRLVSGSSGHSLITWTCHGAEADSLCDATQSACLLQRLSQTRRASDPSEAVHAAGHGQTQLVVTPRMDVLAMNMSHGTTDLSVGPAAAFSAVQGLRKDGGEPPLPMASSPRLPVAQEAEAARAPGTSHSTGQASRSAVKTTTATAMLGHRGEMQATAVMAHALLSMPKIDLQHLAEQPEVIPVHAAAPHGSHRDPALAVRLPQFSATYHQPKDPRELHPSPQEEFRTLACMMALALMAIGLGIVALCSTCSRTSGERTRRPEDILAEVYAEASKSQAQQIQNLDLVKSRFLVLADDHVGGE